ncbi:hypothetical protein DPEC_G00174760 [Dallia pectoralis]|uniref:Uncharacterized protein n=1 Tax=Dallia pectoralis TaxID=75939 RepID=A0ACC2GEC4_DALPE|nr:hypothetical protein DPEC_G00174760 [Dallia pectoralis]
MGVTVTQCAGHPHPPPSDLDPSDYRHHHGNRLTANWQAPVFRRQMDGWPRLAGWRGPTRCINMAVMVWPGLLGGRMLNVVIRLTSWFRQKRRDIMVWKTR